MNTNSITPLTDAAAGPLSDCVPGDFARGLERSLTESRALSVELVKQLLEVTGQRDELRDALKACREDSICQHQRMLDMKYTVAAQQCEENIRRANETLNSLKP